MMARSMRLHALRGAITVDANEREQILDATEELMRELLERNGLSAADVVDCIFTMTEDLNAEFPAVAARAAGWTDVALMCGHEMGVPGSLARCVRILMHVNTELGLDQVKHVYLRGARALRPDLAANEPTEVPA